MPIFDQSYRAYLGERTGRGARVLSIAWAGIRPLLRKRSFVFLLLIAFLPFIVQFVRLYVSDYASDFGVPTRIGRSGQTLAPRNTGAEYFHGFLLDQSLFLFLFTIWVGAGLIADDIRNGALTLYLSRPLSRLEYAVGKLLSLMAVGASVTLIPGLMLWMLLATKAVGSGATPPLAVGVQTAALSAVMLLGFGLTMLAISSVTPSRRIAAIAFAAIYFVTGAVADVVDHLTRGPWPRLLSFDSLFRMTGRLLFGLPAQPAEQAWVPVAAAGVVAGVVGLSCAVLWARINSRSRP
jgi:ABC-type transport system involved in multi-copper enzyme maturation permease subunit